MDQELYTRARWVSWQPTDADATVSDGRTSWPPS